MRPAGRGELDSLYFDYPRFAPPERPAVEARQPVAIVGAGPVGMVAALTLARFGVRSVLLDNKATFNDGSSGFTPIQTSVGKLGVLVCWDQWYPEAARLMALAGAEILIYPTAIGWDVTDDPDEQARQLDAWVTVQRGHAVANNLPVIAPNRVGTEPDPSGQSDGIRFWGNSFICGPQGEFLARGNETDECILSVTLNRQRTESIRRIWPYLRDRRIDAYGDILKRVRD